MESSKPKSIHYRDFVADKELLESIISLTPEGIIGVNLDGIIVIFNEAAEKLTGWKRQEVLEGWQKRCGREISNA